MLKVIEICDRCGVEEITHKSNWKNVVELCQDDKQLILCPSCHRAFNEGFMKAPKKMRLPTPAECQAQRVAIGKLYGPDGCPGCLKGCPGCSDCQGE